MLTSGKVDRKSLPEAKTPFIDESRTVVAPRTETEKRLAAVYAAVFGRKDVSVVDDFFLDLGGHSLLAATVASKLRREPGLEGASIGDIYQYPTIEKLAVELEKRAGDQQKAPAEPRTAYLPPSNARYRLCALGQGIGLLVLAGIYAWQWLGPFFTSAYLILDGWTLLASIIPALLVYSISLPILLVMAGDGLGLAGHAEERPVSRGEQGLPGFARREVDHQGKGADTDLVEIIERRRVQSHVPDLAGPVVQKLLRAEPGRPVGQAGAQEPGHGASAPENRRHVLSDQPVPAVPLPEQGRQRPIGEQNPVFGVDDQARERHRLEDTGGKSELVPDFRHHGLALGNVHQNDQDAGLAERLVVHGGQQHHQGGAVGMAASRPFKREVCRRTVRRSTALNVTSTRTASPIPARTHGA